MSRRRVGGWRGESRSDLLTLKAALAVKLQRCRDLGTEPVAHTFSLAKLLPVALAVGTRHLKPAVGC